DLRLQRADTVVLLETPWWICAHRAFFRGLRKPIGEMPYGCDDSAVRRLRDEWRLVGTIVRHPHSEADHAGATTAQHGSHVVLYRIGSKREGPGVPLRACRAVAAVGGWPTRTTQST